MPARLLALPLALASLLVAAGCSFGEPEPDRAGEPPSFPSPSPSPTASGPAADPSQLVATVLAKGLRVPWGVAFLPDGGALVTERDSGKILKVGPNSEPEGMTVETVQTVAESDARGEGGLMGIAVSPDYDTDKTVFIYYTTAEDNRIARLVLGQRPRPIVTGIPVSGIHNGGRLAFGPDGFLYATTGDASRRGLAQDRRNLGGKILRMTPAGKPAPGNPFNSLVWSYGHRNVQGIAWDPDKRLYATEFGQNTWDELNLIDKGRNYGWPLVEGRGDLEEYRNPFVQWRTEDASPSGLAYLDGSLWAGALRGGRLWQIPVTASGTGRPRDFFVGDFGRMRTVVAAPDGNLWVTTSNRDGRGDPAPQDDRILVVAPR